MECQTCPSQEGIERHDMLGLDGIVVLCAGCFSRYNGPDEIDGEAPREAPRVGARLWVGVAAALGVLVIGVAVIGVAALIAHVLKGMAAR